MFVPHVYTVYSNTYSCHRLWLISFICIIPRMSYNLSIQFELYNGNLAVCEREGNNVRYERVIYF